MIKSNSKVAKNNVQNYISKIYRGEETDNGTLFYDTFKDQAKHIYRTFEKELYTGYNTKRCQQDVFFEWCSGLCGIINSADFFCYNSAVDIVGDLLEQTDTERKKYTRDEAEDFLCYLIYREIQNACK